MHGSRFQHPTRLLQSGFSLVELMIALTLGLSMVAGVSVLSLNATRSHGAVQRAGEQIENGRFALNTIASDLEHAGFTGNYSQSEPYYPSSCSGIPPVIGLITPVAYCSNTNPLIISRAASNLACSYTWNAATNSCDASDGCSGLNPRYTYFQGTPADFRIASNCSAMPCPQLNLTKPGPGGCLADIREYRVVSFSIEYNTLYRQILSRTKTDGSAQDREALVDGIRSLNIQFGLDTAPKDGLAESYAAASIANGADAIAVRITLEACSTTTNVSDPCRSFTQVVHLPNIAHRRQP